MTGETTAIRGPTLTFRADPFRRPAAESVEHHEDALVVMQDGLIAAFGPYAETKAALPGGVEPVHYEHALILPGFVDAHVHFPQMDVIGAYGEGLLGWLERYTFPAEQRFGDQAHADRMAALFLRALLRNGTTTAMVYGSVHPGSAEAVFAESERFGTRMIAGKVMMDRNAPAALLDTAERSYRDSKALAERWHGRGRQLYCVTPRFAPTSTEAQLDAAGALLREHHGLRLQTHLCETEAEIAWVRQLFPARSGYLNVYDRAGLVGPRSVFGHAIHVTEDDFCACHDRGAAIAHCPTSNTFLGSGLFRLFDALDPRRPVRVGLGTDIGGGTSFSQLATMAEAYRVAALRGDRLDAFRAFHLATLGGAEAIGLGDLIGRIAVGHEADLCILDLEATPLLARRTGAAEDLHDLLFALMILGDDRAVQATWIAGSPVYERGRTPDPFRYSLEGR